jgi:hypothetical protein
VFGDLGKDIVRIINYGCRPVKNKSEVMAVLSDWVRGNKG